MSNFEENERLIPAVSEAITRYKALSQSGNPFMTDEDGLELLRIITELVERGFRLTGDNEDWMPPFTLDAE